MKKNILVVIPSLISGGVEVSLIKFLNYLSNNKDFNIDLCLFERKGMHYNSIPKNVNILDIKYTDDMYSSSNKFSDKNKYKGIKKLKYILFRLKLKMKLTFDDWQGYYSMFLEHINSFEKEYDLAIDYRGYGHLSSALVADNVKANKKVMWVHDEKIDWFYRVKKWLVSYDKFYCVSNAVKEKVTYEHKELSDRLDIFYNLIDYEEIREKSNQKMNISYNDCLNIVTVGRLEEQKGYDIAVEIAKKLNEENIDFCWYVLGEGSCRNQIEKLVSEYNLDDKFILLGNIENPFPYVKKADLYLQPSRHEGYGIAIAEARVLGTIPIATNLNCIKEQITDGVNGFLCELDASKFADKIIEVTSNKELIKKVEENLKKENFDYTSEFEKLYKLMEEL